jgi:ribosomal protein S27AE
MHGVAARWVGLGECLFHVLGAPPMTKDKALEAALLPCPHCGPGESVVEAWQDDYGYWRVTCGRCGSSSGTVPGKPTEANLARWPNPRASAIAAWNRRAPVSAPPGEAEVVAWLGTNLDGESEPLLEQRQAEFWSNGACHAEPLVTLASLQSMQARAEAAERGVALEGTGWVFWNPDSGEEYYPDHPVESGICDDAERVRKSTVQEDVLWLAVQENFARAEAAEARVKDLEAAFDIAVTDQELVRINNMAVGTDEVKISSRMLLTLVGCIIVARATLSSIGASNG